MATLPYFVLGPNTLLSLVGFILGKKKGYLERPPAKKWHTAKVDVVIPAYNEEKTIILCLESVLRQTMKPHRIIVIDDGSKDRTSEIASAFGAANDIPLEVIRHRKSVGKTPGVKQMARELDGDVEFILDGDTILESENYIERVVQELYSGAGIASACGMVMPLFESDRRNFVAAHPRVDSFYKKRPELSYIRYRTPYHRFMHSVTNYYRDFLYFFLQKFIYQGYLSLYGSIINPVGCAVAYRREYIRKVFDHYEKTLGDNLTTSEDIFIGFAMLERGYRNVQASDVLTRSEEPEAQKIPRQIYLWSSAFLQSCYYFPELLFSPFKVFRRMRQHELEDEDTVLHKKRIRDRFLQPIGALYTQKYGRPMGTALALALVEKVCFPLAFILMAAFGLWEAIAVTVIFETLLLLSLTLIMSHQYRIKYVLKAMVTTPVRYMVMLYDVTIIIRFIRDVLLDRSHHWRK